MNTYVTLYLPQGLTHYASYQDAVNCAKCNYPNQEITHVKVWAENGTYYHDLKDKNGVTLAQITAPEQITDRDPNLKYE